VDDVVGSVGDPPALEHRALALLVVELVVRGARADRGLALRGGRLVDDSADPARRAAVALGAVEVVVVDELSTELVDDLLELLLGDVRVEELGARLVEELREVVADRARALDGDGATRDLGGAVDDFEARADAVEAAPRGDR